MVDNQGCCSRHGSGPACRRQCGALHHAASSDGLCKDMEVEPTGAGIQVPVGEKTLGRLFNVLGETIDGGESLEGEDTGNPQGPAFF